MWYRLGMDQHCQPFARTLRHAIEFAESTRVNSRIRKARRRGRNQRALYFHEIRMFRLIRRRSELEATTYALSNYALMRSPEASKVDSSPPDQGPNSYPDHQRTIVVPGSWVEPLAEPRSQPPDTGLPPAG